jgi:hypothetical protein
MACVRVVLNSIAAYSCTQACVPFNKRANYNGLRSAGYLTPRA